LILNTLVRIEPADGTPLTKNGEPQLVGNFPADFIANPGADPIFENDRQVVSDLETKFRQS
jgi:hypothetical protein